MEIEVKYKALQKITAEQIEALDFAPYTRGARAIHPLYDTLLDTCDLAIKKERHRLRVRQDGEQYILTLKGPVTQVGELTMREEHEIVLTSHTPYSIDSWPEEIRDRVLAFIGDRPLEALIHVHNNRRAWDIYHQAEQQVAEIVLDEGTIEAGGLQEAMHEIEVELKESGNEEDASAICAILLAHLPIKPSSKGKSKRGFNLLKQSKKAAHAKPQSSKA